MKQVEIKHHDDGATEWLMDGVRHRDNDLPALVWQDGGQLWYQNGQLNREGDLPAMIHGDGSKFWYKHGQLHREGGQPAIIKADGAEFWYEHGVEIKRNGVAEYPPSQKKAYIPTEWIAPAFFLVVAVITPDKTLTWIFAIIGLVLLGYGLATSQKEK